MRIGSIAQHANIGITRKYATDEWNNKVPGRLNDFLMYAWWDFTDYQAVNGGSGVASTTSNLQQCDDKGPLDIDLSSANADKGPRWVNIGTGQDGYWHAWCQDDENEYMQFTPTQPLNLHAFTMVFIFQTTLTTVAGDQHLISIQGTGNKSLSFFIENDDDNFAVSYLNTSANHTYHSQIPAGKLSSTTSGAVNGGDFNWVYVVGTSSGVPKMYIRGNEVKLVSIGDGAFPGGTVIEAGNLSFMFTDAPGGETTEQQFRGIMYEIQIYRNELSDNDLKQIDHYIKTKYPTYTRGRINGYALDNSTGGDNVWPT